MIVSTCEEMNPARRCTMEDSHAVHLAGTWGVHNPHLAYLGVYDGHGGRDMVDYLEHSLARHVAQEMNHDDGSDMATKLDRAFLIADIHARQLGVMQSGATAAVCLIEQKIKQETSIYCANVGDSRVVIGTDGKALRLSQDHRADDPKEISRIEASGGFVIRGRVLGVLAVSRSLGDQCLKDHVVAEPHTANMTLTAQDERPSFVIVACDGLWDVLTDQQAVDFVYEYDGERQKVASCLVAEALRRGTTDNVTAVVAWL